jgi:hypothetical protein
MPPKGPESCLTRKMTRATFIAEPDGRWTTLDAIETSAHAVGPMSAPLNLPANFADFAVDSSILATDVPHLLSHTVSE